MDKSSCFVGQIVHFTCDSANARRRGGHFHVTAEVVKVSRKNAMVKEVQGSYSPGMRWYWPIDRLKSEEQYEAECVRSRAAYQAGGLNALIQEVLNTK